MKPFLYPTVAAAVLLFVAVAANAQPMPASGYIYQRLELSDLTEGCVQTGSGGTFVGVGPAFPPFPEPVPAGTRSIVFVSESGGERVVADGFNAIADCLYDASIDTLYVLDNGGEFAGALTGDTVFAISNARSAEGVAALGTEVVPAGSIPFGASMAQDALGDLYVSDAAGAGAGSVQRIAAGAIAPFVASGFDFTGGLAFDAAGNLYVAEALQPSFDSQITIFDSAGLPAGALTAAGFAHGSVDAVFGIDGELLVTGGTTLASIDSGGEASSVLSFPGFTFGGSVDVDRFTGRIEFTASTFTGAVEDRSVHRLVSVRELVRGRGSNKTDCQVEAYGIRLEPTKAGRPAREAICTDGAECDADGAVNDECSFPLGFCLGVADPSMPECVPSAVAAFEAEARPASAAVDRLVAAVSASLPAQAGTCAFTDGVAVPLKISRRGGRKAGKAKVKAMATTDGAGAKRDRDVFKLRCNPAS